MVRACQFLFIIVGKGGSFRELLCRFGIFFLAIEWISEVKIGWKAGFIFLQAFSIFYFRLYKFFFIVLFIAFIYKFTLFLGDNRKSNNYSN